MKITKQQWQKWASDYAGQSADDFAKHVKLTLEQHVILKAKIEQAALYGIELTATMVKTGADINEAEDMKAALMVAHEGDKTYTMHAVQTDGGGVRLVHETELPDYPRDGKAS